MIRLPGGAHGGRRIGTPVSLMDVMPTLLDLLGVDAGEVEGLRMFGRSLAPAILDGTEPEARPLFSELRADHPGNPQYEWQVAAHYQGFKFIRDHVRGHREDGKVVFEHQLYDLGKDPGETHDLGSSVPERLRFFEERHAAWELLVAVATGGIDFDPGELDPETLEQLRRLGYIK
jgi:arylsulfatase A-like enzyme